MITSFWSQVRVAGARLLSSAVVIWFTTLSAAQAHEVPPAIADMTRDGEQLRFEISLNAESFIAGIDLTAFDDTNNAPEAADYDALRALDPAALNSAFTEFWPQMAARLAIAVDGTAITPVLDSFSAGALGNLDQVRTSQLTFTAPLREAAEAVTFGWAPEFGTVILRQMDVPNPATPYLEAGAVSDPIPLAGGGQASAWQTFVDYIPVGFDHIVPKGLDHILFVLGLFFLSTKLRPLITQVTLFTLAHTITLALAALGYVSVPGSIVEPLIAASITYVAVENIFMKNLSPWRPVIIFIFGLLHGLGFASVLGEFGLPAGAFIPALVGFNIGVEVGQLAVIAVMFLCVWQAIRIDRGQNEVFQAKALYGVLMLATLALIWLDPASLRAALENPAIVFLGPLLAVFVMCFVSVTFRNQIDAYRRIVAIPASAFIGLVGAYWCIERVFF